MSTGQTNKFTNQEESFNTVVIGGGQAGLAVGYYLARRGEDFIILDELPRTGDSWRKRWDSLKLFTPSKFNNLPGAPFPKPGDFFPPRTKLPTIWRDMQNSSTFRCVMTSKWTI